MWLAVASWVQINYTYRSNNQKRTDTERIGRKVGTRKRRKKAAEGSLMKRGDVRGTRQTLRGSLVSCCSYSFSILLALDLTRIWVADGLINREPSDSVDIERCGVRSLYRQEQRCLGRWISEGIVGYRHTMPYYWYITTENWGNLILGLIYKNLQ